MFVPITDEDVPSVVALMNRAYRGQSSSSGWTTEAAYITGDRINEAMLRADLRTKPHAVLLKWIVPLEDRLLGCVWLEGVGGGTWYLGSLTADPDRQNAGLGRTLLSAAEHWIKERGGSRIRMTVVNVREALIAWYLRRGYHLTGEIAAFPYDDDRFGTPLRADLHFVVLEKAL